MTDEVREQIIDYINRQEQGTCGEYHGGPSCPDCKERGHNGGRDLLDLYWVVRLVSMTTNV